MVNRPSRLEIVSVTNQEGPISDRTDEEDSSSTN